MAEEKQGCREQHKDKNQTYTVTGFSAIKSTNALGSPQPPSSLVKEKREAISCSVRLNLFPAVILGIV